MNFDSEYLDQQTPLDAVELEAACTDVMATISGVLAGLQYQLAVFKHHGNAEALELSRQHAADVHAFICGELRSFGRRS